MSNYIVSDTSLSSVADAIREKTGSNEQLVFPDEFVSEIENITGGTGVAIEESSDQHGGTVKNIVAVDLSEDTVDAEHLASGYTAHDKDGNAVVGTMSGGENDNSHDQDDVIFIDYDGTVLYYYTTQEFLALTEMPDNPSHEGLSAQGWNWSLTDAKTYVTNNGRLTIGQTYITDDGKNRFYVNITSDILTFRIRWNQSVSNGVELNWGDGSPIETVSGTGTINFQYHTYSTVGKYCITLEQKSGNLKFVSPFHLTEADIYKKACEAIEFGNFNSFNNTADMAYLINLKTVSLPKNMITNTKRQTFKGCILLKAFVVPDGVTSIKSVYTSWELCDSLKFLSLPITITSNLDGNASNLIGLVRFEVPPNVLKFSEGGLHSCENITLHSGLTIINHFNSYYKIKKITFPNELTSITTNNIYNCYSLEEPVIVPSTVTSIGTNAFTGYGHNELYLLPKNPPTLATTSIPKNGDMTIYVPYSADHSILNAYKTATNWSTYASYMQEMQPSD